jgi:YebC/PmpR family DNA-binding regulatory protein
LAGHSKWAQIKHKKKATDAKRGQMFSKLARAIIVAAKEGGPDPAGNLALQNAIEKAKSYSMPKENIERAIARGAGTDGGADAYEPVVYEGYGPAGVAVIVETLTDNRNRTASDVRHAFTKHDGNLGAAGSVAWLFERRGVVLVEGSADEETVMLAAADAGADDVEHDGSSYSVTSPPEAVSAVRQALEDAGLTVESVEVALQPKTTVHIDDENAARKVVRLMDTLEEIDDVQDVFANFDIPEPVLEAVEG